MKIYTPVKNATGVWCNVSFVNGVGETDNPHLIKWFKSHGYEIEKNEVYAEKYEEISQKEVCKTENQTLDYDSMTPIELREWMKANGYGSKIKNIRNKEKLIEIIRG